MKQAPTKSVRRPAVWLAVMFLLFGAALPAAAADPVLDPDLRARLDALAATADEKYLPGYDEVDWSEIQFLATTADSYPLSFELSDDLKALLDDEKLCQELAALCVQDSCEMPLILELEICLLELELGSSAIDDSTLPALKYFASHLEKEDGEYRHDEATRALVADELTAFTGKDFGQDPVAWAAWLRAMAEWSPR